MMTTTRSDFRLTPVENRLWTRRGIVGWWLNLTAPARPAPGAPIAQLEHIRKAELTSFSILAFFACLLVLVSNSFADPGTARSVGAITITAIITAVLNRTGHTRLAAYLLPSVVMVFIATAILQVPGGLRLVVMPTYDLFVVPIVLVSLVGNRRAPWFFALISMAFMVGDFLLQPHGMVPGTAFDDLAAETRVFGAWGILDRHLIILFFSALLSWMGAESVYRAIIRADRSQEIAYHFEQTAQKEATQARQLDAFLHEVFDALAAQANGQVKLLTWRPPNDPFARYVHFVNNELKRNERLRRQQGTWQKDDLSQAMALLTTRIKQVAEGYLVPAVLTPAAVRTGIVPVDELATQISALLEVFGIAVHSSGRMVRDQ